MYRISILTAKQLLSEQTLKRLDLELEEGSIRDSIEYQKIKESPIKCQITDYAIALGGISLNRNGQQFAPYILGDREINGEKNTRMLLFTV